MVQGIWLVAAVPLTIGGRDLQPGDSFHISRVQSGALLVQGKATVQHPQPKPKRREPEPSPATTPRRRGRPRKQTPEEISENVQQALKNGAAELRRRYQRRDLKAEE